MKLVDIFYSPPCNHSSESGDGDMNGCMDGGCMDTCYPISPDEPAAKVQQAARCVMAAVLRRANCAIFS